MNGDDPRSNLDYNLPTTEKPVEKRGIVSFGWQHAPSSSSCFRSRYDLLPSCSAITVTDHPSRRNKYYSSIRPRKSLEQAGIEDK